MSLNLYSNLPGILTEFKDGGLQLRSDTAAPRTESILLLGTALDGPIGVPVAVDSTTVEAVFGKAANASGIPNGATLPIGFQEAWLAGCRDIRLMRISGSVASALVPVEPIQVQTEELIEQILGTKNGNDELLIDLAEEMGIESGFSIVDDSLVVMTQEGYSVDPSKYELTGTMLTVFANAVSAGVSLIIQCIVSDGTDSLSKNCTVVATGSAQTFTLESAPVNNEVVVYASGGAVEPSKYSVSGLTLTIQPDAAALGATLWARYMSYKVETIDQGGIQLSTNYGGSLYNDAVAYVTAITANGETMGKQLQLVKPPTKRASNEPPLTYSSLDYPTLESMVNAINNDYRNGIFKAEIDPALAQQSSSRLQVTDASGIKFKGGEDGVRLTKSELYEKLSGKRSSDGTLITPGAYQLLENYTVDWIVPLGCYADDELPDPKKNFAQQLAMACAYISSRQHTTYGVIATKPPVKTDLASIDEHVSKLLARSNNYYILDTAGDPILDEEGKPYDIGQYVHVVAGPDAILYNTYMGNYTANSAVIFAAMVSNMSPGSSPLNKEVPGIRGLRFTYSNSQRDKLTAARYITYKTKANGTIVAVEDAMTCAQPGSDYCRTSTVRAVKAAVDAVKDACDPFLGEPNNTPNRNAMSAAIDKRLSRMKELGTLSDYRFNIIASLADQILGKARIELTIVPPFELRQITVVVSLTPTL